MTADKLYSTLKFIENLDSKLALQKSLDSIREALDNLVSSPAQPQYQSNLATALASFAAAAVKMAEAITPSQRSSIKGMGGEEFFDPAIAEKIKTSVQTNAMTPSVAQGFVQDLATRRSSFLSTVKGARQNLEKLGIRDSETKAGSADVAFLIPRNLFANELGSLAKELSFISRLMQDYSEAVTGQATQPELEQLSSSIPTVTLLAGLLVLDKLGTVVNKFLEAWEKIQKIRRVRGELTDMGLKGAAVEELTEQITETIDQTVEESVELVVNKYPGDEGRKKELSNAIRQDTRRLFGQIERGLTIELRVGAKSEKDGEDPQLLQGVSDLAKIMQFPIVAQDPILLENGQVLEGDVQVFKTTKKTTTHKVTISKRESKPKEGE
jgi:hypothetical protein